MHCGLPCTVGPAKELTEMWRGEMDRLGDAYTWAAKAQEWAIQVQERAAEAHEWGCQMATHCLEEITLGHCRDERVVAPG